MAVPTIRLLKRTHACLGLAASIALIGCSGSEFDHAPISGRVTMDGQPLQDATVTFIPHKRGGDQKAGYYSMGTTDDGGRYSLRTVERDPKPGAVVGPHKVIVTKIRTAAETGSGRDEDVIPPPYNDDRVTPLTFTVEPGGTEEANFELATKPMQQQ